VHDTSVEPSQLTACVCMRIVSITWYGAALKSTAICICQCSSYPNSAWDCSACVYLLRLRSMWGCAARCFDIPWLVDYLSCCVVDCRYYQ
jgi:hypothetical protein